MKTKEELIALKEEVETVSRKLHELTEEELAQVSGGVGRIALRGKCDIELLGAELSCFGLSDEPSVTPEFYLKYVSERPALP